MTYPARHRVRPPVREDRYARGPGALLCDVCGFYFDPIATRWLCPHCHTKWPCCDGAPLPPR